MLFNKILKKEDLDNIFQLLAKNYLLEGGTDTISIYIVGGAAIMIDFEYRLSTTDIDAYFLENDILTKAIQKTAKELGLSNDWLNKDFVNTPSFSPKIEEVAKPFKEYEKCLVVFSLEPKYLIAMKLKSSRPTGGDLDDIIKMIYELRYYQKEISYKSIIDAYEYLYPDYKNTYQYFIDRMKDAFETPIEDIESITKRQ